MVGSTPRRARIPGALRGALRAVVSVVAATSVVALALLALRPWLRFVAPLREELLLTLLAVAALGLVAGGLAGFCFPARHSLPTAAGFALLAGSLAGVLLAGGWSGALASPGRLVSIGLMGLSGAVGLALPLLLGRLRRGRPTPVVLPLAAIAALLVLQLAGALAPRDDRPRRVVLLGLDSLDLEYLREMMRRTPLPNFERLMRRGTTGPLLAEPPFSPPSWTTLATGKPPSVHRIDNWSRNDRASGHPRLLDGDAIEAATLFEIAEASGIPSARVGWPVLGNDLADADTPAGRSAVVLFSFGRRLAVLLRRIAALVAPAQERLVLRARDADIGVATIASYLWGHPETRLLGVASTTPDTLHHLNAHALYPPEGTLDAEAPTRQLTHLADAFRLLDHMLGAYLDDASTDLVCFSDHGAAPLPADTRVSFHFAGNTSLDLNPLLEAWGFLVSGPDGAPDLTRSRLYDGSDGLLFDRVCINQTEARAKAGGVSREALAAEGRTDIEEVARRFADLRFEDDGSPVFPGAHATSWDGGAMTERSLAMLPGEPPSSFPNYDSCELLLGAGFETGLDFPRLAERVITDGRRRWRAGELMTNHGWTGTHRSFGLLAGHGPSFAVGAQLQPARGADLTPTVLHLLGLPIGEDMTGRVLEEGFAAGSAAARTPVASTPSHDGAARRPRREDPALDRATEERLRALGYIR